MNQGDFQMAAKFINFARQAAEMGMEQAAKMQLETVQGIVRTSELTHEQERELTNAILEVGRLLGVNVRRPLRKPAPKPPVAAESDRRQLVDYARTLTAYLYEQYGGEVKTGHYPTAFRNRKGSYHHRPNGKHQIVFGYQSVYRAASQRFTEYKSLQYLLRGRELNGLAGVHQLVLHEFAHVLQTERGGRWYGSVHNEHFVAAYQELRDLVPFEDSQDLAA